MAKRDYVSPVERARAVLAQLQREGPGCVTRHVADTARRIALRLEPLVGSDLEAAEAPYRVFRWVAWGKGPTARRQRADLALHLRRAVETSQGGWLEETQLRAALGVWQAAIDEARRRGLAQPRPEDLPAGRYASAVREVTRSTRRTPARASSVAASPRLVLSDEERAALAALPVLERLLRRVG